MGVNSFWMRRKSQGSVPKTMTQVQLYPSMTAQYFYQEKQNWPWAPAPAHEQRSALTNCWEGNQLPGPTNFIPGVLASYMTWNVPTSYANTLMNQQYNKGLNIQNSSVFQQSDLLQQALQNWQARVQY